MTWLHLYDTLEEAKIRQCENTRRVDGSGAVRRGFPGKGTFCSDGNSLYLENSFGCTVTRPAGTLYSQATQDGCSLTICTSLA